MILLTSGSTHLKITQNQLISGKYPDGEIYIDVPDNVKGEVVTIVGSTNPPADNFLELLLTLDTVKRMEPERVNVFVPYLGFGKSDSVKKGGRSIGASTSAKLIGSLLDNGDSVYAINPHSWKIGGYFSLKFTEVSALPLLAKEFKKIEVEVVSPDEGGDIRAREFAALLGKKDIISIRKSRISETEVTDISIEGVVDGKNVVIVDDMVQSGGTVLAAVETLKKHGAGDIYLAAVHMVYSAGGYVKLEELRALKGIVTTNTIKPLRSSPKIKVLDISKLVIQSIE